MNSLRKDQWILLDWAFFTNGMLNTLIFQKCWISLKIVRYTHVSGPFFYTLNTIVNIFQTFLTLVIINNFYDSNVSYVFSPTKTNLTKSNMSIVQVAIKAWELERFIMWVREGQWEGWKSPIPYSCLHPCPLLIKIRHVN